MNWPSSQDYNEAIQNAATTMVDPDLKSGEPTVNAIGLPVPRSGNFADVYQFKGGDGTMWAVKCFTRRVEGLEERYTKINQYLARADLPFTVGFQYLAEGVRIRGQWYPLLKMEWVEGFTLNEFVRQNADKPNYLNGLLQMWAKLAAKLRDANMAHADLQHGNVLLVPGNTSAKLGLKLIDYDGMWVPPLADYHSGEVGHPNFQHPLRLKDRLYNADVDRFPHLVIACALRATLVGGKPLWEKFDNGDNLLFREQDLREPGHAPIFKSLWDLNDNVVRALVGHVALSSQQPLRKAPWLDDLLTEEGGPLLTDAQERQAVELLGLPAPRARAVVPEKPEPPTTLPAPPADRFGVLEEDDGESAEPTRARSGTAKGRRKRKAKKSNLPLALGGGLAALVLAGVVVAILVGNSKGPAPSEAVKDDGPKSIQSASNKGSAGESRKTSTDKKDAADLKGPVVEKSGPPDPKIPDKNKVAAGGNQDSLLTLQGKQNSFAGLTQMASGNPGFSPGGEYFYLAATGRVSVVETATGNILSSIAVEGHPHAVCFGAGTVIFIATAQAFQEWDWKGKQLLRQSLAQEFAGNLFQILPARLPNRLLLAVGKAELVVWDAAGWKAIERVPVPVPAESKLKIWGMVASADQSRFLLDCRGSGLWIWEPDAPKPRCFALENTGPTQSLMGWRLSPNGQWVLATSRPKDDSPEKLLLWDARSGQLVDTLAKFDEQIWIDGFLSDENYCLMGAPRLPKRMILDLNQRKFIEDDRLGAAGIGVSYPSSDVVVLWEPGTANYSIWKVNRGALSKEMAKGPAKAPLEVKDPNRRAAEWVLSIGGNVRVDGGMRNIKAIEELPRQAFQLTWVQLIANKQVTDEGLASLRGCKNLQHVDLQRTAVGDAGLASLSEAKNLQFLQLFGTKVTDAGLANIRGCLDLKLVDVSTTQIGDAGLQSIATCPNVLYLNIGGTKVTDAGLAVMKKFPGLKDIYLYDTQITDAGLVNFKDCRSLALISLGNTGITEAGLANFQDCTGVLELYLYGSKISDAGLRFFKNNKNLRVLHLAGDDVGDAGLVHFKNCIHLAKLYLARTRVTDAGLANFKACKKLALISLDGTAIGDAGLANFLGCAELTELSLDKTKLTDRGLANFKGCKKLSNLSLNETDVGDAGLKQLFGLTELRRVSLIGAKTTPAGLANLANALPQCAVIPKAK